MRWELLNTEDCSSFQSALELPPAAGSETPSPVLFAVESHSDPVRCDWIAGPGNVADESQNTLPRPVAIGAESDLGAADFWSLVLRHHPRHPADLAWYAARLEIDPAIFLNALGMRTDYRTRDEWQGMGQLDADSREFARRYDFPFAVLRLWDRLDAEERRAWRALFEERALKKNFIREIVLDLYDLSASERTGALEDAREFSRNWQARSGTFPGDELRGLVRARRYPRLEENRRRVNELRKELGALPPGTRLHLPPDLEAVKLKLELEFDSQTQLEKILDFFSQERRAVLQKIIDAL